MGRDGVAMGAVAMKVTRTVFLAAAMLAATMTISGVGAQDSSLRADVVTVTEGSYPNAQAVVNIDGVGADIESLPASSFTVTVDGVPVPVVSAELASSEAMPLDVVLLIDVSGSMAGAPMENAREAAKAFVAGLAPGDRVALMAFSDSVRLIHEFTTDRAVTDTAIDGLVPQGGTHLYQATTEAAKVASESTATRRAIILLSDGAHDGPTDVTRELAILTAATTNGVPFFAIGEGSSIDRDYLQQLADTTRGRYLEAPVPAELGALYEVIGRLLRSQYIVTFDASSATQDGSNVELRVEVNEQSVVAQAHFEPGPRFTPPQLLIEGIEAGETIGAARMVRVSAGDSTIERVTFFVGDQKVLELDAPPYTYRFGPGEHGAGSHTLRVEAIVDGRNVETGVTFTAQGGSFASEGALPVLPIVVGSVAGAVLALTIFAWLRRRQRDEGKSPERSIDWVKPVLPPQPLKSEPDEQQVEPETIGEPVGILITRSGPHLGAEYEVGASPVSIGSAVRCGVRVDDPDLAGEEARIWIRNGQLMVHRMTRLTTLVADGTVGGWVILDQGDTFQIGQHQFEFRLLPQESAQSDDVPNVLRDTDEPAAQTDPSQPRGRLFELMPKNDLGTNPD